jgi:uncharacterized RDD family membrane protein YckC
MMTGVSQPPEDHGRDDEPLPPFTMPGQPSAGGSWQVPGSAPPPSQDQPPPGGQAQPQYGGRGAFGTSPGQPYGASPGQQPYGAGPGQQPYGAGPGQQPPGGYQPYPAAGYGDGRPGKDPALAEWWRRLLARFIDWIVLAIIIGPFWISVTISVFHRLQDVADRYPDLQTPVAQAAVRQSIHQMTGRFLLLAVAGAVLAFGYDWLQHGLWGRTLGKRALGTQVVRADTRAPIGGGAACGRAAVYALLPNVPYAGSLFWLINVLWLTWDPKRQCLHDKAASTIVVKKSMLTPPPAQPYGNWPGGNS